MQPLISVIVPIYKVELYLRQCVDSLLAQTYKNLEIILVDDGSPDHCPAICDEYAQKDSRIRVIHKENGGLSDARNVGLDAARGEYVGFVDSDDWVMPDMYEYLYQGMQEYNADIVVCEYYECWKKKYTATNRPEVRRFEKEEAIHALLMLKVGNYAWNKLYKRELWSEDIRYPKGKLYEDVRTTYKLFEKAELVIALPEPKYYYRRTGESITSNRSIRNKVQAVAARIERFNLITDRYPEQRGFMLQDTYRFVPELREAICSNGKEEYLRYEAEIREVSDFLKRYQAQTCSACKLGPFGKLSYRFMSKGGRKNWKRAAVMERLVLLKAQLFAAGPVKKMMDFLRSWKKDRLMRFYYKTCMKMPICQTAFVESRGGEDLAGNMFEAAQELCVRGIKVFLSVKPESEEKVRQILKTGSFPGLEVVQKWSKPYYKAFATSKFWFNDMVFEDVVVKRPEQVYINTWHGTPLKMLEFDVVEQRHNTGGGSRDFLKTDYLAVPSQFLFDKLITSNCVDTIFRGKALCCGYPRNSIFFDAGKRAEVREGLALEGKEVFVYMPTWRGNLLAHSATQGEYSTQKILDYFEKTLHDNQVMLVKLHNYAAETVEYKKYKKVVPFPAQYDAYSVLNVADCLITDYSSVFFDFANTGKKIILFTHDREEYLRDRGLYLDLDELPFPKVNNYGEMTAQLNCVKDYDDSDFIRKYCVYDCRDSAKKMIDFVLGDVQACETVMAIGNGKKNVLIYDAQIQKRAVLSADDDTLLANLDPEEANYFYCYPQWSMKSAPLFLRNMRKDVRLLTVTRTPIVLWSEKLMMKLTGKKALRTQAIRELNRQFYGEVFDEIQVLGNNPYDPFAPILKKALPPKHKL